MLVGRPGRWRNKSNLLESLWVDRHMLADIELLAGSMQRRDYNLPLGHMGNIHSFEGSMAVEAVAADTEVVEAVELDTAAELVLSMDQVLPDLVAFVASREPLWLRVVYNLERYSSEVIPLLLMNRHSHVIRIKDSSEQAVIDGEQEYF
jgi:hypothetical protein